MNMKTLQVSLGVALGFLAYYLLIKQYADKIIK